MFFKRKKTGEIILLKKQLTFLVLVLSLCFSFSSSAQVYYFDNYNVQQGLAQSNIYSIIQDNEGYIWLGTAGGVSKFDGVSFINYTTEDGLADNGVKSIIQTKDGKIWLGHIGGGITRIVDGKATVWSADSLSLSGDITSLLQDKDGYLWVSSYGFGAILIQNPETDSLENIEYAQYRGQEGLSDRIYSMMQSKQKQIFFVTDVGIKQYNKKEDEFDFFRVEGVPAYFQITSLYQDHIGNFWFGTYNGGLYKYIKHTKEVVMYDVRDGLADNWVSCITEDELGNIWVGTWGGGITKIKKKKLFTFNPKNGMKDKKIRCFFEDREGNLLIGTNENGLLIYKGEQFITYTEQEGVIDNQIWSVLEDSKENFWFGTNEGITIYNPNASKTNRYSNFTHDNGLVNNHIRFLKEDKNEDVWIGTWGGGVLKYKSNSSSFEYLPSINNNIPKGGVTSMEIDKENNLWVGTIDGLIYYEIDNRAIARLTQINGLAGNDISSIFCDSEGTLWVGSRGGGITSIKDTSFSILPLENKLTPTSFTEDKSGKLWIGTEGQGLLVSDKSVITRKFKAKDGLLSNFITLVDIDDDNNIWIGTNKGLNKYVQNRKKLLNYTSKVGFTGIEVKNQASYKDKDGNLWFGTIKGVLNYQLDHSRENELEPLTHITDFKVNFESRELSPNLSLNHKEKNITFQFNSICLTDPTSIRYQFMLEGADDDWRPVTKQTFANYSPLPPNNYTFKVKAMNNDGVWNKEPVTFSFRIQPPFWQTWWFYLICIVVGSSIIISFVKIREQSLLKEKRVLEEKVVERTKEVVEKSEELEHKNKDIMDSIRYAKRIQTAILPPDDLFEKYLPESFVLFKPKDIVSGDFYWMSIKGNKVLFAASDCTGHGVPGAFVSIVGYNLLDKIVGEYGITEPAAILDKLNVEVARTFRQKGEEAIAQVQDGMDIALVAYDITTNVLEYAGAFNPLYLEREGKIIEIKGNRFPIGSYKEGEERKFNNHNIQVRNRDSIYIFTDGYVDQFGGNRGKKFMAKQLRKILTSICDLNMNEQGLRLNHIIEDWKGDLDQIDDILVVGARFKV